MCNDRETPRKIPVEAWLYQTKLLVSADKAEVFLPSTDPLTDGHLDGDYEVRRLNLQYRNHLEFAIGRTCSVDWKVAPQARRASAVWTTWLPTSETPQVSAEEVNALLDMRTLAAATPDELRNGALPIVERYADWLDEAGAPRRGNFPSTCKSEGLGRGRRGAEGAAAARGRPRAPPFG